MQSIKLYFTPTATPTPAPAHPPSPVMSDSMLVRKGFLCPSGKHALITSEDSGCIAPETLASSAAPVPWKLARNMWDRRERAWASARRTAPSSNRGADLFEGEVPGFEPAAERDEAVTAASPANWHEAETAAG